MPKTEPPKPEPPKPVAKPKPPTPAAKKPEEKKPAEPDFASVLKNVAKLKTPAPETPPEPAKPQPQPPAPAAAPPPPSLETQLEASQLEAAIRQQVEQCWNVPAGARDAENLIVEIRVQLNPDGSVTDARIVDQSRLMADLAFRAAAESARRAVLVCSPFKNLPAARYDIWRALTLRFDPEGDAGHMRFLIGAPIRPGCGVRGPRLARAAGDTGASRAQDRHHPRPGRSRCRSPSPAFYGGRAREAQVGARHQRGSSRPISNARACSSRSIRAPSSRRPKRCRRGAALRRLEGDQRPGAGRRQRRAAAATAGCGSSSGCGTCSPSSSSTGIAYITTPDNWRRIAHIISDAIYKRLTGEDGYFDTAHRLCRRERPGHAADQAPRDHGPGRRQPPLPDRRLERWS